MGKLVAQKTAEYAEAGKKLDEFKAKQEIMCDFVGEVLFGGENEITSNLFAELAPKEKKAFGEWLRAVLDRIKKIFSKDDKAVSEIAKIEKRFNELLNESVELYKSGIGESIAQDPKVDLSITTLSNGQKVVIIDNVINSNGLPMHQAIANYIAENIGKVYTIIESGQKVYIGEDLPSEYTQSDYTRKMLSDHRIKKAKHKAAAHLGEMIEIAYNRRWQKDKGSGKKDAKYGVYKYKTCFAFPVYNQGTISSMRAYNATLVIINSSDGKKYLYDLVSIKENTAISGELSKRKSMPAKMREQNGSVYTVSISQNSEKSTGNFEKKFKKFRNKLVLHL